MVSRKSSAAGALWLSGNEAIALGAYEAGVRVASGYPGTPSSEILESLSRYDAVYTEWAPNEKVSLETALGASFAGVRALATMKHVGLNVAADPLFTASYTGVRGGLVVLTADDPGMHSSQNEQDNRNYSFAAKLPLLEPADPAEARDLLLTAFELSEQFDTPVLFRITTRIAHTKGVVPTGAAAPPTVQPTIVKQPDKLVMLPAIAQKRRAAITRRFRRLREFAETFSGNRIEWGDKKQGFITAGVSYHHVREAFPEASVLKLALTHPLPEQLLKTFAGEIESLFVVEELDPFLELHIKALGIRCTGKEVIPAQGELNPSLIKQSITGKRAPLFEPVAVPPRPPDMCPGCPHRGIFYAFSRLDLFVAGDLGCYTLAALPPLSALDSVICMGAGVSNAHGIAKALGNKGLGKVVAVLGDSTFIHTGIPALINIVYNQSYATVVILDNRVTAMTGHQPNPVSGTTLKGERAPAIDLENLCRALGVEHVVTVDPHDIEPTLAVVKEEVNRSAPSVIISKAPCALLPEERKKHKRRYGMNAAQCNGCRACLQLGCPAINWEGGAGKKAAALALQPGRKGYAQINAVLCNGCGQCVSLCPEKAISREEESR